MMKNQENYGIQNLIDISRFNDYLKLLRRTAYVIHFLNNLKQKVKRQSLDVVQFLQPVDIENAKLEWIIIVLKEIFSNNIYFNQLKIKFSVFFGNRCSAIYQKILKIQFYYCNSYIYPI